MIGDTIINIRLYSKSYPVLKTIENFIKENPLKQLPLGITLIKGEDLYVNVMEYVTHLINATEARLESHHVYADLHIVEGEELVRFLIHPHKKPTTPYKKQSDVEFFQEKNTSSYTLRTDHFVLLMPYEAHEPGCAIDKTKTVRKYVFKIRI